MSVDEYSYSYHFNTRAVEMADIAAMDRMAAELQPHSTLERWARRQHIHRLTLRQRIRRLMRPA